MVEHVRPRRILGLDPGSRYTGFGVVEKQGSRCKVIAHGRWALPSRRPLATRLVQLCEEVEALIALHHPHMAALESLYHGINPRSLIVLAQARGALLAALGRAKVELYEYTPSEIKAAVTGNGRADKLQVGRMVRLELGLGDGELSADAGDALAAAMCLAQRQRLDRLSAAAPIRAVIR